MYCHSECTGPVGWLLLPMLAWWACSSSVPRPAYREFFQWSWFLPLLGIGISIGIGIGIDIDSSW